MQKILFLDWDGPISNSRTWSMPHNIDPVAVQLLNEAFINGWQFVLTSIIRNNMKNVTEASRFMDDRGIGYQWFDVENELWRTSTRLVTARYLEILQWMHDAENLIEDEAVFISLDDETLPDPMCRRLRITQFPICADEGIGHKSLDAYRTIIRSTNSQLKALY